MAVNVETLGALERRLQMSVPVESIEREVDERLKKLARNAKLAGFRPGKVPMKLVAQTYGSQVRNEVLGDAVQKSFTDAVKAGEPESRGLSAHRAQAGRGSARARSSSAPPSRCTRNSRSASSRARASSGRR